MTTPTEPPRAALASDPAFLAALAKIAMQGEDNARDAIGAWLCDARAILGYLRCATDDDPQLLSSLAGAAAVAVDMTTAIFDSLARRGCLIAEPAAVSDAGETP